MSNIILFFLIGIHGVICQNMGPLIVTTMGTSTPIISWFYKILKTSGLVEQLLASQEGHDLWSSLKDLQG
jgi:hypothetical protein